MEIYRKPMMLLLLQQQRAAFNNDIRLSVASAMLALAAITGWMYSGHSATPSPSVARASSIRPFGGMGPPYGKAFAKMVGATLRSLCCSCDPASCPIYAIEIGHATNCSVDSNHGPTD
jgi:hypothetical protein